MLQDFLGIFSLVNLGFAPFLLLVILSLIFLELGGDLIDELDDFLETRLATTESHLNQIHTGIGTAAVVLQGVECLVHDCLLGDLDLQETAGTCWESLLEELKCIVIVEELDSVGQCKELLALHLLVCVQP